MRAPLITLPVVQNWDCQGTGTCCKEYRINLSAEERRHIESLGYDLVRDLGGLPMFRRKGWFRPRYFLNQRPDGGGCVFLTPRGHCGIHERFGYEAKPLACRLFPFLLIPVGDGWRVGVRFACPSAAASIGRPATEHLAELTDLAGRLARRAGLQPQPDGSLTRPPLFDRGQELDWAVLIAVADRCLALLRDRRDPVELRWRKVLALADLLRQTRLDQVPAADRDRTLSLLTAAVADTTRDPRHVPEPTALGRVVFRMIASLYTRKDYGPNRGLVARGQLALIGAVVRFARGAGRVPRMTALLPEATFEQGEVPSGPFDEATEAMLERYWTTKVESFQFCGPSYFGMSFREGLESLAMTVPLVLWVMRLFRDIPRHEAAVRAVSIVDDHFGFNPLLATRRIRLGLQTIVRRGELTRLIARYGR
jgi:lysine-N-methylase